MLRGELHNAGPDGNCESCGEPFPCPTGLAIYDAVVRARTTPVVIEAKRCPWCGLESNGLELPDADRHRHCRHCAGCIAKNPHKYGTDAYEAWAVSYGNV